MVRKKGEPKHWWEEQKKRHKEELEKNTIRFEYCVSEVRQTYHTEGDGHGHTWNVPDTRTDIVSEFFDTSEEAHAWKDEHEPDEGNELVVNRRRLMRRTYEEWVWY